MASINAKNNKMCVCETLCPCQSYGVTRSRSQKVVNTDGAWKCFTQEISVQNMSTVPYIYQMLSLQSDRLTLNNMPQTLIIWYGDIKSTWSTGLALFKSVWTLVVHDFMTESPSILWAVQKLTYVVTQAGVTNIEALSVITKHKVQCTVHFQRQSKHINSTIT